MLPRSTPALESPLILVIDIGSSSTRAALYDASAAMLAGSLVQERCSFFTAADGTAEDDPAGVLHRVARCIDGVLAAAGPRARDIAAVGLATYVASVLGTDAAGQPVTPIYTYADTRSAAAARLLRERLDERAIWQRTGCPLRTSYLPALLTWLAQSQPQVFRAARRWMGLGEWLLHELFGRSTITFSAAAWTGLLNRTSLAWDDELLAALPVHGEQLGDVVDASESLIGLREPWAARWPSLRALPWFGAIGDGAAANLGSGCTTADRIALSIGTTGALRTIPAAVPTIPRGLWCYRVDRVLPLLGGATNEGGNVLTWALRTLQVDLVSLQRHLLDPAGDDHGLTVLPFISGERCPGWAGDIHATITGISTTTSALDMARAALEGVTYRWAQIAALLRQTLDTSPTIVVSGGAIEHLPAWAQLIADAVGLPVAQSGEPEATSRGIALLALQSLGVIASLDERPATLGAVAQPNMARWAEHQAAIERQAGWYERLYPPG
ncbi:MAG TPA: gluconokinase [Herpetosiphonaceae bacterium]